MKRNDERLPEGTDRVFSPAEEESECRSASRRFERAMEWVQDSAGYDALLRVKEEQNELN